MPPAPRRYPPVRAVLFDLDGTLYHQPPLRLAMGCEIALAGAAGLLTRGPGVPKVIATFRRLREELRDRHETNLAHAQYAVTARALGVTPQYVEQIVSEWMYARPLKWIGWCRRGGVVETLQLLEARRIRTGVLSDYPAHEKLAALGLEGRFDPVLCAVDGHIDAFKPEPRGFLAAAEYWGVSPAEVLYVGDRLDVDAAGAAAAGMRCAILTGKNVGDESILAVRDFEALRQAIDALV